MTEKDPDELAGELDREADDLERRSRKLEGAITDARDDWERKRADQSIAGAPPPERDDEQDGGEAAGADAPPAKD